MCGNLNSFNENVLGVNTNSCGCNNGINDNNCGCYGNNNNNVLGAMTCSNCNCNGGNSMPQEVLGVNTTNSTLQQNLRNYIGRKVCLECRVGDNLIKRNGILTCVGCDFVTLSCCNGTTCTLVDISTLQFVTICN